MFTEWPNCNRPGPFSLLDGDLRKWRSIACTRSGMWCPCCHIAAHRHPGIPPDKNLE